MYASFIHREAKKVTNPIFKNKPLQIVFKRPLSYLTEPLGSFFFHSILESSSLEPSAFWLKSGTHMMGLRDCFWREKCETMVSIYRIAKHPQLSLTSARVVFSTSENQFPDVHFLETEPTSVSKVFQAIVSQGTKTLEGQKLQPTYSAC